MEGLKTSTPIPTLSVSKAMPEHKFYKKKENRDYKANFNHAASCFLNSIDGRRLKKPSWSKRTEEANVASISNLFFIEHSVIWNYYAT